MPAGGKATVRSRRLGTALKRHREAAGLDQADGAEAILKSVSKISRLESGQTSASALEVRTLLDRYGVEDAEERARLLEWARKSNERGWWIDYQEMVRPGYADHITLENDATCIRSWSPTRIPGLLQTPDYTEAVITIGPKFIPSDRVVELVKLRQERQRRIEEGGTHFTAIIWEPAVTALTCERHVRTGQLTHLLEVSQRQNITLQLLPAAESLIAGMSGAFVAFSFGMEANVEAVTLENPANTNVVEAPEDLALYVNVFDQLRSAALSPDETTDRIRQMLDGGPQRRERDREA
ncbi:helix-turn-helix domain-containing protein [Streptomyces sp. Je 1-4]|uniref:helix-turn-helix domain-containing protein n=1 Tax=Streptomyces TaxID=1883 RepID=UPI0021DACB34|nr:MULTISPECIES: helix-turn-helix transcriptional regulator [unclassified Streptomyces]UYB40506.1 helix-turn-helix domain-containing protein [Streptomyces sp. Je 1-4]UZQ36632.1 helix-turn-helix domain-containing protein [Streptomyces sp. Je 1-4] [Streptomyces sp. Je 1-4 4N24]UZQ44049.1 helix-turn-helix domain-containing protein [Streptomyces sp. Je 1-4] [Streptomyces sp. Je 1-4 4N24_ara]